MLRSIFPVKSIKTSGGLDFLFWWKYGKKVINSFFIKAMEKMWCKIINLLSIDDLHTLFVNVMRKILIMKVINVKIFE